MFRPQTRGSKAARHHTHSAALSSVFSESIAPSCITGHTYPQLPYPSTAVHPVTPASLHAFPSHPIACVAPFSTSARTLKDSLFSLQHHQPRAREMAAATAADNAKKVEEAQKLAKSSPAKAEQLYKEVLSENPGSSDAAIKNFETALVGLGELFRDQKKVNDLADLVQQTRSVLSSFAKAKTAKLGENMGEYQPLSSRG